MSIEDLVSGRLPRILVSEFWHYVWYVEALCVYCNTKLNKQNRTLDHVVPRAQGGGALGYDNLVPCCQKCNWTKADKRLLVFLSEQNGC